MGGIKYIRPCKRIKVINNVLNLVWKASKLHLKASKLHCLGKKREWKVSLEGGVELEKSGKEFKNLRVQSERCYHQIFKWA